jgi:hypothetical protein
VTETLRERTDAETRAEAVARKHDRATYGTRERHVELAARYRAWAREANARARRYDQMGENR